MLAIGLLQSFVPSHLHANAFNAIITILMCTPHILRIGFRPRHTMDISIGYDGRTTQLACFFEWEKSQGYCCWNILTCRTAVCANVGLVSKYKIVFSNRKIELVRTNKKEKKIDAWRHLLEWVWWRNEPKCAHTNKCECAHTLSNNLNVCIIQSVHSFAH